jgi:ribosomal-protein-serine acetyltransferase
MHGQVKTGVFTLQESYSAGSPALEFSAEPSRRIVLQDRFISLRPFQIQDIPLLFEAARESVHELSAWMVWCHAAYSMEDSATFISNTEADWERGQQYSFAIIDREDGTFLGSVGINAVNHVHKFANLGYWVRTRRTRQGVGTSATILAARFGLEQLGLHRVELVVPTGNKASQRVAEKAGATCEGVFRKRLVLRGRSVDAVIYSFISGELALG